MAWVAMLYVGVFFARDIQHLVERTIGRGAFILFASSLPIAGVAYLVMALRRRRMPLRTRAWGALAAAAYLWGVWHLRRNPEEAMHLLEYAVLSLLIFRAFGFRMQDRAIFLASALLAALVGTGDEILQWLAPNRSFDFRDIAINVSAGAGIQLVLGFGLRPDWTCRAAAPRSLAVTAALAGLLSATLLACLCNTLSFQTHLLARLTFLPDSIRSMTDTMTEYGYLHRGADGVSFYSRLTLEELRRQDAQRAGEVAAILKAGRAPGARERLAQTLTGVSDPFLYEADIHLFRRDKYTREAVQLRRTPERACYAATIAYRENQIMEHAYPTTLADAALQVPPDQRAIVEQLADREAPHVSAVSSQLITRFHPRQAAWVLGSLTIAAWLFALYHARRHGNPSVR